MFLFKNKKYSSGKNKNFLLYLILQIIYVIINLLYISLKEGIFMDVKEKVNELVDKVKNDKDFGKKFMSDPIKAVESVVGVDLPDEKIKEIAGSIKDKVNIGDVAGKLGGLGGIIDKLK